jgi:hypothetical protein
VTARLDREPAPARRNFVKVGHYANLERNLRQVDMGVDRNIGVLWRRKRRVSAGAYAMVGLREIERFGCADHQHQSG